MGGEMSAFEAMAERRISETAAAGGFNDLAGKGKPIDLDSRPDLNDPDALAAKVLRDAGVKPAWLELKGKIDSECEALRRRLRVSCQASQKSPEILSAVQVLNGEIKRYNL